MRIQPILPPWLLILFAVIAVAGAVISLIRDRRRLVIRVLSFAQILCITLLALVVGLRPQRREIDVEVQLKNLDVLFVLDTTISMWAEDYNGRHPRMGGALSDIRYILNELDGSNFGLICFDDRSRIIAPYTQDTRTIRDDLLTISMPDYMVAEGSDMSVPYHDMESLLVSSNRKENRRTIVFFISDGENTNGAETPDYSGLAGYIDGGAVLGYGTQDGGYMSNGYGGRLVDSETGQEAVSFLDEDGLTQMAQDLGVTYINMDRQERITLLLEHLISEGSIISQADEGMVLYEDLYYMYVIPLIALLALSLVIFILRGRVR